MVEAQQESGAAKDEAEELSGEEDLKHGLPSRMGPPNAAQRQSREAA